MVKRHEHKNPRDTAELLIGRQTQTGRKPNTHAGVDWFEYYVPHIRGCEICLTSFIYTFMTVDQMAHAIKRAHRR